MALFPQGLPLPIVFISFGAAFDEYGTNEMLDKINCATFVL